MSLSEWADDGRNNGTIWLQPRPAQASSRPARNPKSARRVRLIAGENEWESTRSSGKQFSQVAPMATSNLLRCVSFSSASALMNGSSAATIFFRESTWQRSLTCNLWEARQRRIKSNKSGEFWSSTFWGVVMSMKYELIIFWSDDDQSFVVEVPELQGCMADGGTYEQAVANAKKVIAEWIETARELGRPIPEPKGRLLFA
ncbi:MAG: type II toxin-antitoxin system HicB family antitoxin [Burkholderiales bacterium]